MVEGHSGVRVTAQSQGGGRDCGDMCNIKLIPTT